MTHMGAGVCRGRPLFERKKKMGFSSNDAGGAAAAAEQAAKDAVQAALHPLNIKPLPVDKNIPAGKSAAPITS
jgi:hypothetical protein